MTSVSVVPVATGVPVEAVSGIWRITAPNPGVMTGPGTNSYVLGKERQILIDPGPNEPEHIAALLEFTRGALTHILVTHTHLDHSPAAKQIANVTNACLVGLPPPATPRQDQDFRPELEPQDSVPVDIGGEVFRCVHTPGHASNHICYLHEQSGVLFTGDHVMQGSTVVIPPPDGDMTAYIESLEKLRQLDAALIAPGHGVIIERVDRRLRGLVRHRLQRESRVRERLREHSGCTLDELLPLVYNDVPAERHPIARFSLHAHLLKLESDGEVVLADERWQLVAQPG